MDTSAPFSNTSRTSSVIYSSIPPPQFVISSGLVVRPQSSSPVSTPLTSAFSMTPSMFSPQTSSSVSTTGSLTSISSEIAAIRSRFPSPAPSIRLNLRHSVTTVSSTFYNNPSVGHMSPSVTYSGNSSPVPSVALDSARVREPSEDGIPTSRSSFSAPLAANESGSLEIDEQDGSTTAPRIPSRTYTVQSYFPESFKTFHSLWYAQKFISDWLSRHHKYTC